MKKYFLLLITIVSIITLIAQDKLNIFKSDNSIVSFFVAEIDSIKIEDNATNLKIYKTDNSSENIFLATIDSIKFENTSDTVSIIYSTSGVTVNNPLENYGVSIVVNGSNVIVNSSAVDSNIKYILSGSSASGSIKFYSDYRFGLILNGLSLTNPNGPAINIQSGKRIEVVLASGTSNILADGTSYSTSNEDQKGTFFSEGQLIFNGSGTLNVTGNYAHAICSDDFIEIYGGIITVPSAIKDAIHANDEFKLEDGTLNLTATSDGVECEAGSVKIKGGSLTTTSNTAGGKGISCDSTLNVSGGIIMMTVKGNSGKGLKANGIMNLSGGTITVTTSGNVVLENLTTTTFDPSYCTAIKGNSTINLTGSTITIVSTGAGGKGISSDADINMSAGNININCSGAGTTYKNASNATDSYNANCFKATSHIYVNGGNLSCTASGAGGKSFSSDGTITISGNLLSPIINLTTKGARFLVSGTDYCHPKTMAAAGEIIINNGTTIINSSDDGIHSGTSISISGGQHKISAISTTKGMGEGIEAPLINIIGGTTLVEASNDGINATYGTVSGGTESNDNSNFNMKGGILIVNGSDAVDSNGNVTTTGGILIINGPQTGAEEGIDYNGSLLFNGGTVISAGSNSNMTKAMSTSSTQPGMYIKSSSAIAASSLLHIENSTGENIITYKPKNGGYYFHFTSPSLVKAGSYKIYTGGSYTGGSFVGDTSGYGMYSGGSYSTTGAILKSTTTLSSSSTVNTITF